MVQPVDNRVHLIFDDGPHHVLCRSKACEMTVTSDIGKVDCDKCLELIEKKPQLKKLLDTMTAQQISADRAERKGKPITDWELTRKMCERRTSKLEKLCQAVNQELLTYAQGDNHVEIKVEHKGATPQIVPKVQFYF